MTRKRQPFQDKDFVIGILGGGQLGKMLCQKTAQWGLRTEVLDTSQDYPAGSLCSLFTEGDFKDFETVLSFGRGKDVLTIEIESVNSQALLRLAHEGIPVFPNPEALNIIKDKGLQKQFYHTNNLPSSSFSLFGGLAELLVAVDQNQVQLPCVVKARRDGYDGRSVLIARSRADLQNCSDTELLVEPLVSIEKELSVIVARGLDGSITPFPSVAMAFHPTANLVEYLHCPAGLEPHLEQRATEIACATIEQYDTYGLLAVEMFLTTEGEVLINEVAPRPHNSGHHTIEACNVSQFEQHLRAMLGLPLAEVSLRKPAVMVNLLGDPEFHGPARYKGVEEVMHLPDVHIHLYGKQQTKPHRKMGHVTILADRLEQAVERAKFVRNNLHIVS